MRWVTKLETRLPDYPAVPVPHVLPPPPPPPHPPRPRRHHYHQMGFFDLNIPYHESDRNVTDKSSLKGRRLKLALKAMELGYTGVAYNLTLKGVMSESDRCSTTLFPLSKLTLSSPSFFAAVKLHRELLHVPVSSPFRQYTRLTLIVDIASQASALNAGNPILRSYDIVAVRPMNQNAFDQACQTSEVDMIAIDFSEKLPFRLKQQMVTAAIKRGVYFEITYAGLIADVQSRRQMISNCKLLVDWTRGKNLIFSSAALSATELRGPQDVSNLFSLLGLQMECAKAAISKNCRSLLANALRKKHFYKEAIKVEEIPPGGQGFDDWLKWDPISSGEGDLLLDEMEKSFAFSNTITKTVKTINFTSNMNGLPAHGLQIKDLIRVTDSALRPPFTDNSAPAAMEVEKSIAAEKNEEQDGRNSLNEEQSSLLEMEKSFVFSNTLTKTVKTINFTSNMNGLPAHGLHIKDLMCVTDSALRLPVTDNTAPTAMEIEKSAAAEENEEQDGLNSLNEDQSSLLENQSSFSTSTKEQDGVNLLQEGQTSKSVYQVSGFESCTMSSLPTYDGTCTNSEETVSVASEKLDYSNNLEANLVVASETQLEDSPSQVYGENALHDGESFHTTKYKMPITDDPSIEVSDSFKKPSSSASESKALNVENQYDLGLVDKVSNRIGGENKQEPSLASSSSSSLDAYVESGQYSELMDGHAMLGCGLPNEGSFNLTAQFNKQISNDVMAQPRRIDSVGNHQGLGRERRKRNSPHKSILFPFKRFLNPRPLKKKSRK